MFLFICLDANMIKWEKIDFWVVPMISIGMCLLSEVIDKIILAILFCIFASIKVQQNQFGNQVQWRRTPLYIQNDRWSILACVPNKSTLIAKKTEKIEKT